MTTSPASRRQSFTYDGRALEIRVVFSDENWTTWVYEDGHHLAAVGSVEHSTVDEGVVQGTDVIGELIEASVSEVLAGDIELPPRKAS
jgi:hypothetical protein